MLTQEEVEKTMYLGGVKRATESMKAAEENGEAARNPYAATLYRDYVMPLASLIIADVTSTSPGRLRGHAALLAPLDPEAVAFLTVRGIINCLVYQSDKGPMTLRQTAAYVGASVHQELVLAQIEDLNPELYHTLARDFNRRRSKNVRHRMTVFKMQAAKAGLVWAEWGMCDRDLVGIYLCEAAARLGLCEIDPPPTRADGTRSPGKLLPLGIVLAPHVIETITRIKGFIAVTSPVYGPCVEPPLDWHGMTGGGFHTQQMQRTHPYLVKAHATARELLREHDMPIVCAAANMLQHTAWRVNQFILRTVKEVSRYRDTGEILTHYGRGKPTAPDWLATTEEGDRTDEQQAEFKRWKRAMAIWHTERKLRTTALARFTGTIRSAEMFKDQPELYFVYFADSRGRFYPLTYGMNPQGSDLQKSMLQFAIGKPLHDDDARRWFCIHGANKWGFDKAPLADRAKWWVEREQMLLAIADDPVANREWEDADSPLQFLAWCKEFAEWRADPDGFLSHLPVSLDGSCNGLQHFSAMLRDESGGRATNLTDNEFMQDIYMLVANAAAAQMRASVAKLEGPRQVLVQKWVDHGIERSLVKRSVMTTPYGVTKRTAVSYAVDDYLQKGSAPVFANAEYFEAAQVVMEYVWNAIGEVVVKSREAMDWLKRGATRIIKARGQTQEGVISWLTPSGFLATQAYYEIEEERVRTRLHGSTRILVVAESDEASPKRHASGLAPNFVHSMDAAHLHLTAAAASGLPIDALAMIHDDYGTHAADTQLLFRLIRATFVDMYKNHDPIADFAKLYPEVGEPPAKGTLDIEEVIYSDYFFS